MITADIAYIAVSILLMVIHYVLWSCGILKKNRLLSLIALLPIAATFLSLAYTGWDSRLIPAYLGTVLYSLAFTAERPKRFLPAAIAAWIMPLLAVGLCSTSENYRLPIYAADFDEMFGMMKDYYVLGEYKAVDWDALYDEYMPRVKALKRDDDNEYFKLCYQFCNEFNDLHVSAIKLDTNNPGSEIKGMQAELCGKDPGFTGIRLDDGKVLACSVSAESTAYKAGLRNGCQLTRFNGVEINEYIDSTRSDYQPFADIDNLNFCRPLSAFGVFEDKATVTFIAEDGSEVTADIIPTGNYADRIRAVFKLIFGEYDDEKNYRWQDMGSGVAYMEINDFMAYPALNKAKYGSEIWELMDNMREEGYKQPAIYLQMRDNIDEMQAAGINKLIIDMRSNGGGMVQFAGAVIDFFTDKPINIAAEEYTSFTTHKTSVTEPIATEGNYGKWNGEVVILVSPETVSAAEIFTATMSKLPNVTVMGLTESAGSAMGVSSIKTGLLRYQFPMMRMVDDNGDILIDGGADMQSTSVLDVRLPMDEEAFKQIFVDKNDYTVDCAVKYLSEKA